MYNYDDCYDENIYESSPLDELMQEYREKCKTVLLASVQSEIDAIKARSTYIENENKTIREENNCLKSQLSLNEQNLSKYKLFATVFESIKRKIDLEKEKSKNDDKIFDFLSYVFKQDYSVRDEHDAPLWIKSLTAFYSNKEIIIDILNMFDYKYVPKNIKNFRLPLDWNEDEIDIFFKTLRNHSCTNSNTYNGNLGWYNQTSLEDVDKQCNRQYSQIPWQFVLRNPILKQPKYLEKIGKEIISSSYSNGCKFIKISSYQDLSDDELKIIIENLDYIVWSKGKNKDLDEFILDNIKSITNKTFLNKVYEAFKDSYDFRCRKKIFDMPFEYIKKWSAENKNSASEWLRDSKAELDKEQRRELMEIILG